VRDLYGTQPSAPAPLDNQKSTMAGYGETADGAPASRAESYESITFAE